MTPKEKAKEMIGKYMSATNETSDFKMELYYHIQTAKKCALIAVNSMLEEFSKHQNVIAWKEYTEVKEELNNL